MKKFRKLLFFAAITALLTCLLCVALNAETYSGTCGAEGDGSNLTWSLDTETGVLKIEGRGEMKDYSFRGTPWYNYCSGIKNAKIGDGVTSIGDSAFYNCSSLASIEIPSSVTSIGDSAFFDCSSLTSIEIPSSVTSIGDSAFYNCSSLTSITFGDNSQLTSIGYAAFYNCSSLTSIEIPSGVISIGGSAFGYCSSLTSINVDEANKSYKLIDGVLFTKDQKTLISYPAKKEGTAYTIPDSVTSIGDSAFSCCSSLTSIEIPSSVTSIGNYAFSYCSSLTSIEIPNSVTSIGGDAFSYCFSLASITFGDSSQLTSIGDSAFSYCSSLASIEIPSSVISIGDLAFNGCWGLTSIKIFSDTVEIYDSSDTISYSATIYGYKGSTAETYATKYGRKFIPLKCDEHNFGDNYKHDDINHWLECADCGEKKDEAAHTFRQRFDKTHHWNECSCGFIKDKSEHTLDEEGKCTECRFGRVMLGDLNGDGKISAIDLTLMRKYIAGYKVDMIEAAADLNGDGRITAIDLTMLRKYIAGLIAEF